MDKRAVPTKSAVGYIAVFYQLFNNICKVLCAYRRASNISSHALDVKRVGAAAYLLIPCRASVPAVDGDGGSNLLPDPLSYPR